MIVTGALLAPTPTPAQTLYIADYNFSSNIGTVNEYDGTTGLLVSGAFTTITESKRVSLLTLVGNDLYIANQDGTVGVYSATTGTAINSSLINTGLVDPAGLVVSGNNLYILGTTGKVGEFNASTGATINSDLITVGETALGLAISGNTIYVSAQDGTNAVQEYDATSGAPINTNFINVASSAGLPDPGSENIEGNDLYLGADGTILEFNATTGAVVEAPLITGVAPPPLLDLGLSGNDLYVMGGVDGQETVDEYDATTGAPIKTNFVSGLNSATGMAVAPAPEPCSAALLSLGLSALFGATRVRRHGT